MPVSYENRRAGDRGARPTSCARSSNRTSRSRRSSASRRARPSSGDHAPMGPVAL